MIRVPGALALIVSFIAAASAAPAGTPCPDLKAVTIPAVTITSAAAVPAGPFSPPGSRSPMMLPAFCRIEGVARPVTDSEIKFELGKHGRCGELRVHGCRANQIRATHQGPKPSPSGRGWPR